MLSYSKFYCETEIPSRKRKTGKSHGEVPSNAISGDATDSSSSSSEDEDQVNQPKMKKLKWIKKKLDKDLNQTTVDLELAGDFLEASDTLLKVFQCQQPMIHVINPTILEFTKESFLEITSSRNLKHSDGKNLSGNILKALQFETEEGER